jgi:fumarate hydratase subunit beta
VPRTAVIRWPSYERNSSLEAPLTRPDLESLQAGAKCAFRIIYTGRRCGSQRLIESLNRGESLPLDPNGQIMYYVGPTPAAPGGSSVRPDRHFISHGRLYSGLVALGLRAMIGKGRRTMKSRPPLLQYGAVYLAATGGAGALLAEPSRKPKSSPMKTWDRKPCGA